MATKKNTIEKSHVTIQPPGIGPRFALMGKQGGIQDVALYEKRGQYSLFYEMYRQHPVVRAAIDRKANFASAGGMNVVSSDPRKTLEVPEDKANALKDFLRESQYRKLLRLTYKDLDVYGESFWLVVLNLNNRPMRAMRLNPRFMNPVVVAGEVIQWKYGPVMQSDEAITYDANLVLHFTLEDPESDVTGISPLYALQRTVAQDIFAMEYNENFFKNAAQTGTIFVAKTADAGEARRAREWIEANYTGADNAHRPLFIEGDVSVEKSVSTRVEMEFLEGRKFIREEISMVLEVDLEKLGIHAGSNRSISKEQEDAFHSEAIRSRQITVEDEINWKLVNRLFGWDDVVVEHAEADVRRRQEQVDIWNEEQKMGRMSINDIRAEQGKPALENQGAAEYMLSTPAGTMPIDMIAKIAERQLVPEPISGVGTTSTGQRNPANRGRQEDPLSPAQAEESKMGDR